MHQILKMCGKRSVRLKRFLPPVVTAALSADACTGIKRLQENILTLCRALCWLFLHFSSLPRASARRSFIITFRNLSSEAAAAAVCHVFTWDTLLVADPICTLPLHCGWFQVFIYFFCKTCKNILRLLKPRRTSVVPENATLSRFSATSTLLSPCAAAGFSSCSTAGDGMI